MTRSAYAHRPIRPGTIVFLPSDLLFHIAGFCSLPCIRALAGTGTALRASFRPVLVVERLFGPPTRFELEPEEIVSIVTHLSTRYDHRIRKWVHDKVTISSLIRILDRVVGHRSYPDVIRVMHVHFGLEQVADLAPGVLLHFRLQQTAADIDDIYMDNLRATVSYARSEPIRIGDLSVSDPIRDALSGRIGKRLSLVWSHQERQLIRRLFSDEILDCAHATWADVLIEALEHLPLKDVFSGLEQPEKLIALVRIGIRFSYNSYFIKCILRTEQQIEQIVPVLSPFFVASSMTISALVHCSLKIIEKSRNLQYRLFKHGDNLFQALVEAIQNDNLFVARGLWTVVKLFISNRPSSKDRPNRELCKQLRSLSIKHRTTRLIATNSEIVLWSLKGTELKRQVRRMKKNLYLLEQYGWIG